MKPTFRVCFSEERPDRPGLWLCFRDNLISVVEIQDGDIERDKRTGTWLDGLWAGCLAEVEEDVTPLDRTTIQEKLDQAIKARQEAQDLAAVTALQELRVALIGEALACH